MQLLLPLLLLDVVIVIDIGIAMGLGTSAVVALDLSLYMAVVDVGGGAEMTKGLPFTSPGSVVKNNTAPVAADKQHTPPR